MPRYRFHFRTSHRVFEMWEHDHDDDEHAKAVAAGDLNAADPRIIFVEIWQDTRLVGRIRRDSSC